MCSIRHAAACLQAGCGGAELAGQGVTGPHHHPASRSPWLLLFSQPGRGWGRGCPHSHLQMRNPRAPCGFQALQPPRGVRRVHPEQRPKRTGPPAGNRHLLGCSFCRGFLNPAQPCPAAPGGALDVSSPGSRPHPCSPLLGLRVAVCRCLTLPVILGPGQTFSLTLCFFFFDFGPHRVPRDK